MANRQNQRYIERIPVHTLSDIHNYIERRVPPGHFLTAILSNDLKGAFERADHVNREVIGEIVTYLYNECPAIAWGSPERVRAWLQGEDGG